jgi:competence protein ComEC
MTLLRVPTRFRAYRLDSSGSSFSYATSDRFTLVEGRLNEANVIGICDELIACNRKTVSRLELTSWERDHCCPAEVGTILRLLKPDSIEMPGHAPHCDAAWDSFFRIQAYRSTLPPKSSMDQAWPHVIATLPQASPFQYSDVYYYPNSYVAGMNNQSTMKLYRGGAFTVLSLGDVEDESIAEELMYSETLRREVDVLVLAHHGANNGFTSEKFIKAIQPSIAIATCDHDNQHDHPHPSVRAMLF